MALADIRNEVIHAIAQTNEEMREARAILELGGDREKVWAAGELDFLIRQRAMLGERLATLDWRIAEHRTLFSWARQAWFSLRLHFESWIAHG